jgi:hypothetical protein
MFRRLVFWAVVLFVLFYVATQPAAAGSDLHAILNGVHGAANSLAQFVSSAAR